jgi:hypothetical protein
MPRRSATVLEESEQTTDDYPRTEIDIDLRAGLRHFCAQLTPVRAVVRPTFRSVLVYVRDVSTTGIGLRCIEPWSSGSHVAINWNFGGPAQQRTLRAHVVHATWDAENGWLIGCAFETPLSAEELENLLGRA